MLKNLLHAIACSLILMMVLPCQQTFAQERDNSFPLSDFDFDSLLKDIVYHYDLNLNAGDPDFICEGFLTLSLDVPEGTEEIYFRRTPRPNRRIFNVIPISCNGESNLNISIDRVFANTFFKVTFFINGKGYTTSTYDVNTFISPEDLEILQSVSSVGEMVVKSPVIEMQSQSISIKCTSELNVSIHTLDGRTIYYNTIDKDTEISISPGIYILNAQNSDTSLSKKVIIR